MYTFVEQTEEFERLNGEIKSLTAAIAAEIPPHILGIKLNAGHELVHLPFHESKLYILREGGARLLLSE